MEGPWVKVLQPVELTGSGRPRFEQGEVECQLFDKTDLVDESTGWALKGGNVSLTTHRILWLDEKAKVAWAVPLGAAGQVYASKKGLKSMFAAPSMRFQVWTQKDGRVSRQGKVGAQGSFVLTIVFKGKSWAESFLNRFGEALQAKAWTVRMNFVLFLIEFLCLWIRVIVLKVFSLLCHELHLALNVDNNLSPGSEIW